MNDLSAIAFWWSADCPLPSNFFYSYPARVQYMAASLIAAVDLYLLFPEKTATTQAKVTPYDFFHIVWHANDFSSNDCAILHVLLKYEDSNIDNAR